MLFPFFLVLSGDLSEAFCEVRQTQELLRKNKRERDKERERADIKVRTQTVPRVFTNRE